MTARIFLLLFVLWSSPCLAAGSGAASDTAWQAQFAGAPSWSTYGVTDDSGVTDNTSALNSIPGNTPIIADCPHGGYVQFTGTWNWPNGLTIWQKPGCILQSTITTPGTYPTQSPALTTTLTPITNVQYYGAQWKMATPTSTVRFVQSYINHFKFKYFTLDGACFGYLRGSDQEIAFGQCKNVPSAFGNPGIRHFGNVPKVQTSAGMHANVWIHNNNFDVGDGAFQSCQPGSGSTTWGYNVSSDDILYENNYGVSHGSAVILANEPVTPIGATAYTCTNITYRNITGSGLWAALVWDNDNSTTQNILFDGFTFDGSLSSSNFGMIGAGQVTYGGSTANGTHVGPVTFKNLTMTNVKTLGLNSIGVNNLNIVSGTIGGVSVAGFNPQTACPSSNSATIDKNGSVTCH